MVSEKKIFEKVYDNGCHVMAKPHMTFGQMSQDNYKYIKKIHVPKYFKANTNFVKEWLFTSVH